jgi:YndJ-like protein
VKISTYLGAAVWLLLVLPRRPSPFETGWAVLLLLLGALVIVPLGLRLVTDLQETAVVLWRLATIVQFPAALLLVASFGRPPGTLAAVLALPWLATTALIALIGLLRAWNRGWRPVEELCFDAGLIYLVVGGGWTVLSRFGYRPLGFEDVIVLLTGIHFHYAGFALPIMTGLAGRLLRTGPSRLAAAGVIVGVPLVALGITARQLAWGSGIEVVSTWVMSIAGLLTSSLLLRLALRGEEPTAARILWAVAAVSLAFGMVLSLLYGSRSLYSIAALDIPWMRAFHGTANALGTGLVGLLGWNLATRVSAQKPAL